MDDLHHHLTWDHGFHHGFLENQDLKELHIHDHHQQGLIDSDLNHNHNEVEEGGELYSSKEVDSHCPICGEYEVDEDGYCKGCGFEYPPPSKRPNPNKEGGELYSSFNSEEDHLNDDDWREHLEEDHNDSPQGLHPDYYSAQDHHGDTYPDCPWGKPYIPDNKEGGEFYSAYEKPYKGYWQQRNYPPNEVFCNRHSQAELKVKKTTRTNDDGKRERGHQWSAMNYGRPKQMKGWVSGHSRDSQVQAMQAAEAAAEQMVNERNPNIEGGEFYSSKTSKYTPEDYYCSNCGETGPARMGPGDRKSCGECKEFFPDEFSKNQEGGEFYSSKKEGVNSHERVYPCPHCSSPTKDTEIMCDDCWDKFLQDSKDPKEGGEFYSSNQNIEDEKKLKDHLVRDHGWGQPYADYIDRVKGSFDNLHEDDHMEMKYHPHMTKQRLETDLPQEKVQQVLQHLKKGPHGMDPNDEGGEFYSSKPLKPMNTHCMGCSKYVRNNESSASLYNYGDSPRPVLVHPKCAEKWNDYYDRDQKGGGEYTNRMNHKRLSPLEQEDDPDQFYSAKDPWTLPKDREERILERKQQRQTDPYWHQKGEDRQRYQQEFSQWRDKVREQHRRVDNIENLPINEKTYQRHQDELGRWIEQGKADYPDTGEDDVVHELTKSYADQLPRTDSGMAIRHRMYQGMGHDTPEIKRMMHAEVGAYNPPPRLKSKEPQQENPGDIGGEFFSCKCGGEVGRIKTASGLQYVCSNCGEKQSGKFEVTPQTTDGEYLYHLCNVHKYPLHQLADWAHEYQEEMGSPLSLEGVHDNFHQDPDSLTGYGGEDHPPNVVHPLPRDQLGEDPAPEQGGEFYSSVRDMWDYKKNAWVCDGCGKEVRVGSPSIRELGWSIVEGGPTENKHYCPECAGGNYEGEEFYSSTYESVPLKHLQEQHPEVRVDSEKPQPLIDELHQALHDSSDRVKRDIGSDFHIHQEEGEFYSSTNDIFDPSKDPVDYGEDPGFLSHLYTKHGWSEDDIRELQRDGSSWPAEIEHAHEKNHHYFFNPFSWTGGEEERCIPHTHEPVQEEGSGEFYSFNLTSVLTNS